MDAKQIAAAAYGAGFRGDKLTTAVAVAMAESGGNPRAHNNVAPDNSYGLWQINMLGSMGPARRRAFGIKSNDQLFDPVINAKAAWIVSTQGRNWRPWSVYTGGQYKRHLPAAKAASADIEDAGGKGALFGLIGEGGAIDNPLDSAMGALTSVAGAIVNPNFWLRIVQVLGGGILMILGALMLTKEYTPGPVKKAATAVALRKA